MKKNYDVLIAGAGPVGLTLANILGQYGHSVCVLEKEKSLFPTPRAVAVDDESLRIWQQIGLAEKMGPFLDAGDNGDTVLTYLDTHGQELMSLIQREKPYGYSKGSVILQHEIDKILLSGLNRFSNRIDVLFGHNIIKCSQTKNVTTVYAEHSGKKIEFTGKYLVACDGGKSVIRSQLGIKMHGFTYPQSWLIVDTIEDRKERTGATVFCDPKQPIATIPLPKNYRRFEFFLREHREANSFSESAVWEFLNRVKQFKIKKIVRHLVYTFNARIADKYRSGRIFLAGDAGHVTPPFAGQGLATGLRDVANLGWKLSERLNGNFSDNLLDTYESERRPHQKKMIKLAVSLGKFMTPKNKASALLHGAIMRIVSKIKFLRNWIEIRGQNIQPVYEKGFIADGKFAGKYFPQPVYNDNGKIKFFDELLGKKFAIISIGEPVDKFLKKSEIKEWKDRGAKFLHLPNETAKLFADFIDISNKHLFIIRPDRFIYKHIEK